MTRRWQFKVVKPRTIAAFDIEATVNRYLEDGWEPFAVDAHFNVYLRREVESF